AVSAEFGPFLGFGLTKPTGLDSYGQILAELSSALGESGSPDPKQFSNTMRSQKTKLATLVAGYNDRGWETPVLERILNPPLRGSEVAVLGASHDSANRKWCDSVVTAFEQSLGDRYPFVTGKEVRDARLTDLEKFFQPRTGTLWQ